MYDEDTTSDDELGSVTILLDTLLQPPLDKWVQVKYKSAVSGDLHLAVSFTPNATLNTNTNSLKADNTQ